MVCLQVFGDTHDSLQLFAAYKNCLCSVYQANAESLSILERRTNVPNFNNNILKVFFSRFNDICCHSFLNCFSTFNYYSMPILQTANFTNYLNASKHIFSTQWAFLSLHHNINLNRDREQLTDFKESQVFLALLILQWMSNSKAYHIGVSLCQQQCMGG